MKTVRPFSPIFLQPNPSLLCTRFSKVWRRRTVSTPAVKTNYSSRATVTSTSRLYQPATVKWFLFLLQQDNKWLHTSITSFDAGFRGPDITWPCNSLFVTGYTTYSDENQWHGLLLNNNLCSDVLYFIIQIGKTLRTQTLISKYLLSTFIFLYFFLVRPRQIALYEISHIKIDTNHSICRHLSKLQSKKKSDHSMKDTNNLSYPIDSTHTMTV